MASAEGQAVGRLGCKGRRRGAGGLLPFVLALAGCRAALPDPGAAAVGLAGASLFPAEVCLWAEGVGDIRLRAEEPGEVTGDFGDGLSLRLAGALYRGGFARTAWRDLDGDGTPDLIFRAVLAADGEPLCVAFLRRPCGWERYLLPGDFR